MSPPDTNTERQAKRHKGPLIGIAAAVVFAIILLFVLISSLFGTADGPEGSDEQIDGRTGEVIETE